MDAYVKNRAEGASATSLARILGQGKQEARGKRGRGRTSGESRGDRNGVHLGSSLHQPSPVPMFIVELVMGLVDQFTGPSMDVPKKWYVIKVLLF